MIYFEVQRLETNVLLLQMYFYLSPYTARNTSAVVTD